MQLKRGVQQRYQNRVQLYAYPLSLAMNLSISYRDYLHAYGAGVDFFKLIQNNTEGKVNESIIGKYDDGVLMMMYDSVVIVSKDELVK